MRLFPATLALALVAGPAVADHQHPTETITDEVGRFYAGWMRPDRPNISCCDRKDCYATEARFVNGQWQALRREDGKWLTIPESKIERNREMPDARAHLCAPPPQSESLYENGVICFGSGAGG
jgi:hypothetical protein